jgi:hypothetical protein
MMATDSEHEGNTEVTSYTRHGAFLNRDFSCFVKQTRKAGIRAFETPGARGDESKSRSNLAASLESVVEIYDKHVSNSESDDAAAVSMNSDTACC